MAKPSPICLRKISNEMKMIAQHPEKYIIQKFDPKNMLHCYYVFLGPEDTPYHGGVYFGKVTLPPDYPFKPPTLEMMTPSGRFKPGQRICISISDFHPETWNPSYNVSSVLMGLLSFMTGNETGVGIINDSDEKKRQYARDSMKWNANEPKFIEMFPELL